MENQASPRKGKRGLRRIFNAFNYSLEGLGSALKHEYAFRQEVILAASFILVLILELINSAIEAVVDDHSLRDRPLAKRAKDIGSAAVLLGLLNALACWTAILAVNWNQLL